MTGFGRASVRRRQAGGCASRSGRSTTAALDVKVRSRELDAVLRGRRSSARCAARGRAGRGHGPASATRSSAGAAGIDEERVRARSRGAGAAAPGAGDRPSRSIWPPSAAFMRRPARRGGPTGESLWQALRPAVDEALAELRGDARRREGERWPPISSAHRARLVALVASLRRRDRRRCPTRSRAGWRSGWRRCGGQAGVEPAAWPRRWRCWPSAWTSAEELVRLDTHLGAPRASCWRGAGRRWGGSWTSSSRRSAASSTPSASKAQDAERLGPGHRRQGRAGEDPRAGAEYRVMSRDGRLRSPHARHPDGHLVPVGRGQDHPGAPAGRARSSCTSRSRTPRARRAPASATASTTSSSPTTSSRAWSSAQRVRRVGGGARQPLRHRHRTRSTARIEEGNDCLFDIDYQGGAQIRRQWPKDSVLVLHPAAVDGRAGAPAAPARHRRARGDRAPAGDGAQGAGALRRIRLPGGERRPREGAQASCASIYVAARCARRAPRALRPRRCWRRSPARDRDGRPPTSQ